MDLFYYGSQDTPLPRRRGRAGPHLAGGSRPPLICESCGRVVSEEELRSGRATEVLGLVLCETCRILRRAEERIELYFCDRCHVSIPVCRVDTGEALSGDGRILCLSCRTRRERRKVPVRLGLAAILVLLAGGIAGAFSAGGEPDRSHAAGIPSPERALLDKVEKRLAGLPDPREAARLASAFSAVADDFNALEREWAAIREGLSKHNLSLHRLRGELNHRMDLLQTGTASLHRELDNLLDLPMPR